jgi:hypothetical protein
MQEIQVPKWCGRVHGSRSMSKKKSASLIQAEDDVLTCQA